MINPEEGDVPPNAPGAGNAAGSGVDVVDQTITGCETTKGHVKRGAVEFWANVDKYNLKHKDKNSKRPPSSFLKVSPLNTNLNPKDIEEGTRGDGDHRSEKE